ncbi:Probable acyltransferase yihG [Cedecea neteri]|uniref:Probable acyltransferase yihG n=1 Tax=Cedecea neteri TaxID=158822 RepID=A0A2X2T2H3_9ENTR|nr:Probable acyltransferase yihG [Cedecea neteri]
MRGSRFTPEKKGQTRSPFNYLLPPKAAGIAMAMNVLGKQFDKMLNVTLCYPENNRLPFYDMLSGKMTKIVVRVSLVPITEELHGDYVNDKSFKRRFQLWLNMLWSEKDKQLETLLSGDKKPVNDRLFLILFLLNQVFHRVSILLHEDIHAAGIHSLHVQLIFAINIHGRYALQAEDRLPLSLAVQPEI